MSNAAAQRTKRKTSPDTRLTKLFFDFFSFLAFRVVVPVAVGKRGCLVSFSLN
jgi:hypothetical protein